MLPSLSVPSGKVAAARPGIIEGTANNTVNPTHVYSVKEIYKTVQGEGWHTGRSAVFLRFAGCNLWSGREKDRADAICSFCDTDFLGTDGPGGGKFRSAADLAAQVRRVWEGALPPGANDCAQHAAFEGPFSVNAQVEQAAKPYVVCTGGEPLLQLDDALVAALHGEGFDVGVETNGTKAAPGELDWICVSPKAGAPVVLTRGHELKLVYHQKEALPNMFAHMDFEHFFLQPMDGPDRERFTEEARAWCARNPPWKLSLQTHKILGVP